MNRREADQERATMNHSRNAAPVVTPLGPRSVRVALLLTCILGILLTVAAAPVGAEVLHNQEGSFAASETPSQSFGLKLALGVDNSGGNSVGDVYVGGVNFSTGPYVYKFDANGKYTGVALNGSETPGGSFTFLSFETFEASTGVAVDGSTGANEGDVYVADAEHHVIDRFSEAGKFLCEITGREYASLSSTEQEHECAGSAGSKTPQNGFTPGGALSEFGVAVDPVNGEVYVADPGDKAVDEFNQSGEYIGQITDSHLTNPGQLALNATGELYVVNRSLDEEEDAVKFDAKGNFVSVLDESAPAYVAVDPANGRAFVDETSGQEKIAEYDPSGTLFSTFSLREIGLVAVSASTGRSYISGLEGPLVYMFGKATVVPNVKTAEASEVSEGSATLHGEAEPDLAHAGGNVGSCEFEYASDATLDHIQTLSATEPVAGDGFSLTLEGQATVWAGQARVRSESTTVSEVVTSRGTPVAGEEIGGLGIKPGTTIVYYDKSAHVIALSQETEFLSPEQEEATQGLQADLPVGAAPKTVQHALEALSSVGTGNVTVTGPAGGPWTVEFTGSLADSALPLLETGARGSAGQGFFAMHDERDWAAASKVSCAPPAPYSQASAVSAKVTGLVPSASYLYRLVASDPEGAAHGEPASFTTFGAPSVDRVAAEAKQTSVRFWAKVNPFGADTKCQVQYVTAAAYRESLWAHAVTAPCERERLGSGSDDLGSRVGSTAFPYVADAVAMAEARELARGTAYRYRFLATNPAATATHEGTFETWGVDKFAVQLLAGSNERLASGSMLWEPGEVESPLQSGAHPYEMVTTIGFSHTEAIHRCEEEESCPAGRLGEQIVEGNETLQNVKDIKVQLPPGLIGNPTNFPKCNAHTAKEGECPTDSQVGVLEYQADYPMKQPDGFVAPTLEEREVEGCSSYCLVPLFNLEPQHANPAEFANPGDVSKAQLPFEVRAGADYGVTDSTVDIIAAAPVQFLRIRIWGVPANPGHAAGRHFGCPRRTHGVCSPEGPEVPLLRSPTSCAGAQTVKADFDTWVEPGIYTAKAGKMEGFTGCDKLKFEPSFEAQPTTNVADSPTGLHVDLHVPQDLTSEGREDPKGLATADLENATVALPAGMAVNPSSADGLQACSEEQIGYLPQQSGEAGKPQFTPDPASCPDASKIGTVEVNTRLIDHPLTGGVYVAAQDANPFSSLLALYIAIYDPTTGVVVKLAGKVTPDPVTGQLTATFDQNPQLPFDDFKLDFFSGARATLTTPLTCGSYSASTDLTPWSAPEGGAAMPLSVPFSVIGAGGAPCVSAESQAPNAPVFEAGTASPVGGSFSPFVLHLARENGSQHFSGLNVTLPPGLTGKIAGIEQCPEGAIDAAMARSHEGEGIAELAHPSCPAGSEVGVVHVGAGSGAPYYVTGHVYFAGPYKGAPFSLVIVTPAVAGPFDLGTVVVRAALSINPSTAQVTVKSDPFPTILDGIPLDIRSIGVEMNRSDFVLNPTSCNVMAVTGEERSTAGNVAGLSSRFQAGGCTNLPFAPSFTASTQGKASKADGASLTVRVNPLPGQANIAKVDLQLPKQLPSRLTTLQKACTEAQFNANPAGCPEASAIGSAVAHTPILNSPLVGPAYLVSHGGAAFPDVEFVLQGEGVEIVLDGGTQIKNGVTYSHFETVPDAPITSFETILPEGPHSVLGTNLPASAKYSLCGQSLTMPTMITGQNGAVVNQTTKIGITGCPPARAKTVEKALTRAQKLKAALKACRAKDKGKSKAKRRKRETCEKSAQKRYGPQKKGKQRKASKGKRGK
jgi:DNA-binding beta-propeller fold protein YncE